jgi:hypothetical protein
MNRAIEYIEQNLDGEIIPAEFAGFVGCSAYQYRTRVSLTRPIETSLDTRIGSQLTDSTQICLIDDSGDPGFKLGSGSTPYFVIACVIFDDLQVAADAATAIRAARIQLGFKREYEFKFNKLNKSNRKAILAIAAAYDFRVRAIVVDKAQVRSHEMRTKPDSFYNFVIKEALSSDDTLEDAKVRLDGHSGREYKRQAVACFRREINSKSHKISDFRYVDSTKNDLIQLADLVAGAINRSKQQDKTDHLEYIAILKDRIEEIWDFE